jgi:hypothetical protein
MTKDKKSPSDLRKSRRSSIDEDLRGPKEKTETEYFSPLPIPDNPGPKRDPEKPRKK